MTIPSVIRSLIVSTLLVAVSAQAEETPLSPLSPIEEVPAVAITPDTPEEKEGMLTDVLTAASHTLPNQEAVLDPFAPAPEYAMTVAFLMPPDGSPVLAAAKIVANGVVAAGENAQPPVRVLQIEAPENVTLQDQLDAAVMAGANLVIGPIEKRQVEALAKLPMLPLPVLALNIVESAQPTPMGLTMMGISTENEARDVAALAIREARQELDKTPDAAPLSVAIIAMHSPHEERLAQGYESVLLQEGVPFTRFYVDTPEEMKALRDTLAAKLSDEDRQALNEERQSILAAPNLDEKTRERRLKRWKDKVRAQEATSASDFQVALLATDIRMASLVRNLLPLKTEVWATSTANPGDPRTSSTAMTLSYDLNGLHFADSPLLVKYTDALFQQKYKTPLPYSTAAKRLFAFGADALQVAEHLAKAETRFDLRGETGRLALKAGAHVIDRQPDHIRIENGTLIDEDLTPAERLAAEAQPEAVPEAAPTEDVTALPKAQEHFDVPSPLAVMPVVISTDAQ